MDDGEEDYIFIGTPIEREEDTSRRKRKAAADAGQLRSLPPWKQEVTDEEGRRRFHGAFTGGFSAGYFNTVGTKEGWTPQTFTSSRKNRAEVKQQSIYNFLDEDEKAEFEGHALETSSQFDTFGFTAAEFARKQAEKEHQKRPSAIPGPVPDEIVLPATSSIGVKLLLKMGWRQGHSIEGQQTGALYNARREARKAFLALSRNDQNSEVTEVETSNVELEDLAKRQNDILSGSRSTPVFVLNPKQDLYGLGYDPFKHAPEFRDRKNSLSSENKKSGTRGNRAVKGGLFASTSGKVAPGFGIGALEELDVEDEDIYESGFEFEDDFIDDTAQQPLRIDTDDKLRLQHKEQNMLPGFRAASRSDYSVERFPPPVIPHDFQPHHKFPPVAQFPIKATDLPPPEVPAPEEKDLKLLIDGFATLVTRGGKLFEDLTREKNKANPLFSFLSGGKGHDYYVRKLWEEQKKNANQRKLFSAPEPVSSVQKLTAEDRGRILGERPLGRSESKPSSSSAPKDTIHLQSNLSDTFMKPISLVGLPESAKAFRNDPAKQERFEQFLKDKFEGGLRSTYAANLNISEAERARERLDFEAAAEGITKGESIKASVEQLPSTSGTVFVPGGLEQNKLAQHEKMAEIKVYPKREEFQWRPSPVLCKRFDIIDPFMGKPPPLPRARSKLDSLIFMSDSLKTTKVETFNASKDVSVSSPAKMVDDKNQASETDILPSDIIVEKPVDLYKAIFSDDSDEDGDVSISNPTNGSDKFEGANATLNHLIAGDFLESLGKQLGLEVPDTPLPSRRAYTSQQETSMRDPSRKEISKPKVSDATMERLDVAAGEQAFQSGQVVVKEISSRYGSASVLKDDSHESLDTNNGALRRDRSSEAGVSAHSGQKSCDSPTAQMMDPGSKRRKSHSNRRQSSSSSDTDSSRDHKRHRHRRFKVDKDCSSSDSGSSDDEKRHRSSSKMKKKKSSRKSRKHSERHKHKSKESSARGYNQGIGRDHSDHGRKDKRPSREHGSRRSRG